MTGEVSEEELDAVGLVCPEPLMKVRNKIRQLEDGQVLYIRASDPTTEHDLKNFCHFLNHDLLRIEHSPNLLEFWIRKGVK